MLKSGFFTFHIVEESPWPLFMSMASFNMAMTILFWVSEKSFVLIDWLFSLFVIIWVTYGWMSDIMIESTFQGFHTKKVKTGLKMGMVMFIASEVMFFASFFWSLFYFGLNPSTLLGGWPPVGVEVSSIDPMGVPLLGTLILISSGVSITWSHHSMLANKKLDAKFSLALTIMLGISFTLLQLGEYSETLFAINDSVYGSIFFLATGFHGFHVFLGSMILVVCFIRMMMNNFSKTQHVGYEMGIWYWHFVDVVWLFLYVCLYWSAFM